MADLVVQESDYDLILNHLIEENKRVGMDNSEAFEAASVSLNTLITLDSEGRLSSYELIENGGVKLNLKPDEDLTIIYNFLKSCGVSNLKRDSYKELVSSATCSCDLGNLFIVVYGLYDDISYYSLDIELNNRLICLDYRFNTVDQLHKVISGFSHKINEQ